MNALQMEKRIIELFEQSSLLYLKFEGPGLCIELRKRETRAFEPPLKVFSPGVGRITRLAKRGGIVNKGALLAEITILGVKEQLLAPASGIVEHSEELKDSLLRKDGVVDYGLELFAIAQ